MGDNLEESVFHKREWPLKGLSLQRPDRRAYQPSYNVRVGSPAGRGTGLHLANQLLAIRPLKPTLRFPGTPIGRLKSLSEHPARRREHERNGCKKEVGDQEPDEVRAGLRATEDVRLDRHVHSPEGRE